MSVPSFVYDTVIATTLERLWEALTSGEVTRRYWFDRRIESDWTPGAPVLFFDGASDVVTDRGAVLECAPPRHLVYSFAPIVDGATFPATRVSFTLEPQEGGVRLLLIHDQLGGPDDVERWRRGWTPILTNLRAVLEGRVPDAAAPASG